MQQSSPERPADPEPQPPDPDRPDPDRPDRARLDPARPEHEPAEGSPDAEQRRDLAPERHGPPPPDIDPYGAGLVGNCQSAMLVHRSGAVIWGCLPSFDSPSVFARVLDPDGGHLAIEPADDATACEQAYLPLTNILVTRFEGEGVAWEIFDWMPRYYHGGEYAVHPPVLFRWVRVREGRPRVRISCRPRPNYARDPVQVAHLGDSLLYTCGAERFYLQSNLPLSLIKAEREMFLNEDAWLCFSYGSPIPSLSADRVRSSYDRTRSYWERWSRRCHLTRDFQGAILRSALCLKLLTYDDTGAIIAAPTTSLPETPGEERNWDYRFCWVRDSYFIVRTLARLAHFEEQQRYLGYLQQLGLTAEPLQPVYGIAGQTHLHEVVLEHMRGAFASRPVRAGNQAWEHVQNDIYGELVLTLAPAFFDMRFHRGSEHDALWQLIHDLAETVMRVWRERDASIWEYRDLPDHYVFSKVMCWVALDQASRVADHHGQDACAARWAREARVIRQEIMERGYNRDIGAFTGTYDGDTLDAALLLMPHVGFLDPCDPRYRSTLDRIEERLVVDGMCYRYRAADDFGLPVSTFAICTFWWIDALYFTGQGDRAREQFSNMLARANHLGLFAEGMLPDSHRMTGNFPQGYTHVAIIHTGMLLSREWGAEYRTGYALDAAGAPAPARARVQAPSKRANDDPHRPERET